MQHFSYGEQDIVLCEVCSCVACDVHHIEIKGIGGNSEADHVDNLIGLCRPCHDIAHGKVAGKELSKEQLFQIVNRRYGN